MLKITNIVAPHFQQNLTQKKLNSVSPGQSQNVKNHLPKTIKKNYILT